MKTGGIVLAGGSSTRMGTDKALLKWGDMRSVDRVFHLLEAAIGGPVLVSGGDYGQPFVPDPPGPHGPASGVVAGCGELKRAGCQRALILAVDAPTIELADLKPLLAAPRPGACFHGLPLPMVIEIAALPLDVLPGWPLRRLVERAGLHVLPAPHGSEARLRGANTAAEREALEGGA